MKLRHQNGFTLAELATVMVIIGLVLGGLLTALPAQIMSQQEAATKNQLNDVIEALTGYAIANKRLPCPALAPPAGGAEATVNIPGPPPTTGCTNNFTGYLPASTLGLSNLTTSGYLLDSWGNPIRYAITPLSGTAVANAFTTGGAVAFGGQSIQALNNALTGAPFPGLIVCSDTPRKGANSCTIGTNLLTQNAVAIVWSDGPYAANDAASTDVTENNVTADKFFINHEWREPTGNSYHQIMVWLPYSKLFGRMVQAGSLP